MPEPADELNYKHLRYLWLVAREGSVTAAARACEVEQSAVSTQLKRLEQHLRQKLFEKDGRRLRLTAMGQVVFEYADNIFRLGRELDQAVRHGAPGPPLVTVGVTDVLPKLLVYKLLEPIYALPEPVRLVVIEGKPAQLIAELAVNGVDLVLGEAQPPDVHRVKVYHHLLGECGVTLFAVGRLAGKLRRGFPHSLDAAPFLLPTEDSALRRSLDHWFASVGVRPDVRGEFADSALIKVFGRSGCGAFALPTAVEQEVTAGYDVQVIGRVESIRSRVFAISAERKITHPAVLAIRDTARQEVFAAPEFTDN